TVPLCACILGNLPPTMERALASAWEEDGAIARETKDEGDRGRWKTGREAVQKGRHKPPLSSTEPDPVDTACDEPRRLFKATNVSFPLSPGEEYKARKGFEMEQG
ncbi:hypothetical protein JOQ06_006908, partial [Pogonophryne albipinna]